MQATLDMDKIYTPAGLIKTNEFLLHENGNWLHFTKPQQIIIARELNEVLPALLEVERLIQANDWYAAGFVSYEAAPAFDSALRTQPSGGFPYLWFGLYPQPDPVNLPATWTLSELLNWQPTIDRDQYNAVIVKIKAYIAQGKTYQVNYTMRIQADFSSSAWCSCWPCLPVWACCSTSRRGSNRWGD